MIGTMRGTRDFYSGRAFHKYGYSMIAYLFWVHLFDGAQILFLEKLAQ